MKSAYLPSLAVLIVAGALAGCGGNATPKHMQPLSYATVSAMEKQGLRVADPILIRIYKEESKLEVWKRNAATGQYQFFKSYDICVWSGELGPKQREGDRQAPEGFYTVTPAQMNPNSSYWLSFNLGYPNAYDRSYGRTGAHLMVHGACSSAGCYSMEDEQIQEIYSLARDAFAGGQQAFQVQAFPFRMTPENFARHIDNPNMAFWQNLKEGADHFEVTRAVPAVDVCDRRYVFNADEPAGARFEPSAACPQYQVPMQVAAAVAEKQARDRSETEMIVARLNGTTQPEAAATTMVASAPTTQPTSVAASLTTVETMPDAEVASLSSPASMYADETPSAVRRLFERVMGRSKLAPQAFAPEALEEVLPPVISGAQPILPVSWTPYAAVSPRR